MKNKIWRYTYTWILILTINSCLTTDAHMHLLDAHASIVKAITGAKHE